MDSVVIHGSVGQKEVLSLAEREKLILVRRILGPIYNVLKPIRHNPGMSLPLIFLAHGFCGYPWLCRSKGGTFSLAARDELTLILEFWELYILYPSQ